MFEKVTLTRMFVFSVLIFSGSVIAESQTLRYTYDELGRLTFVIDNINGNRDYDYDEAGNRCAVTVGAANDNQTACATPPAPTVPARPTGLTIYGPFAPIGGYRCSWDEMPGAIRYELRLADGRTLNVTAGLETRPSFESNGPRPSWVRAVNSAGTSPQANF